ncbi:MAG TPA: hypothetical protein VF035_04580 [Longimicrobiales bacterium]
MRRFFAHSAVFLSLSLLLPASADAQIRPVDPFIWRAFDGPANVLVSAGVTLLPDQAVAATGTRGRYEELGAYRLTWRTGRAALTASGAAIVRLVDEDSIGEPYSYVREPHRDAGPVIVEAATRLTSEHSPVTAIVRFGTLLPVTSAESGMDRDEADFFATFGMRARRGRTWVAGEGGVGINGRPEPFAGQRDVLNYSIGGGYRHDMVDADVWLVGRDDMHDTAKPSHEDLDELRIGVRSRGRFWIGATWIHGLTAWSPSDGVRIAAGMDAAVHHLFD